MDVAESKKILDVVEEKEPKIRITVSIDPKILDQFKRICGNRPISPVVEQLMRRFIDSFKSNHLSAAEPNSIGRLVGNQKKPKP